MPADSTISEPPVSLPTSDQRPPAATAESQSSPSASQATTDDQKRLLPIPYALLVFPSPVARALASGDRLVLNDGTLIRRIVKVLCEDISQYTL